MMSKGKIMLKIMARLKPAISVDDLASKWDVSEQEIKRRLDKGMKVEREHTSSDKEARQIASHHIEEMLEYYDKLAKMEKKAADSTEMVIQPKRRRIVLTFEGVPERVPQSVVNQCLSHIRGAGWKNMEIGESDTPTVQIWEIIPKVVFNPGLNKEMNLVLFQKELETIETMAGKWARVSTREF